MVRVRADMCESSHRLAAAGQSATARLVQMAAVSLFRRSGRQAPRSGEVGPEQLDCALPGETGGFGVVDLRPVVVEEGMVGALVDVHGDVVVS